MSKKKRRVGRPSLKEVEKLGGGHTPLTLRKDIFAQMDAEIEKHSAVLGFTINRQQFMEILLTNWRNK